MRAVVEGDDGMKALGICQQMSVTVSTAALSSPYGWMGAQNLCCQIYASEAGGEAGSESEGDDTTAEDTSNKDGETKPQEAHRPVPGLEGSAATVCFCSGPGGRNTQHHTTTQPLPSFSIDLGRTRSTH
eukprot:TRINITY_DN49959_c0_g1_i2.p3 TRINITY_DN49959_c0_g1~~TRINITY_DN49959_c0_g1_i2.p3  ORF type:complete len:129 (+),score=6.70 TRINITY_DN49959_c0_g1_i2:32-418(+)